MEQHQHETIAGEFKRLDGMRQTRLQASEQFAYYTIPAVFPRIGNDDNNAAVGMLDSIGSAVANHFANKLVTTLFSPNRPFFRLMPDSRTDAVKAMMEASESEDPQEKEQAEAAFADLRSKFIVSEKEAVRYLERIGYRTSATQAAKLLIITGDVVIRSSKGRKASAYSMRDYVCEKDLNGDDVVLIVRDNLVFGTLTKSQQDMVREHAEANKDYAASTPITIYTRLELAEDGRYLITQAIENMDIKDDEPRMVTKEKSVFTHLSWNLSKGENYGRGLVEDFSGSFNMIDNFTNFQARMAAKIADIKILVDPASGVDVDELNSTNSGTYISGKPGDVNVLASGLDAGMQYMETIILSHKRQVSSAFLYQTGQVRDAERVTAEEIRENAAELEIAHGGVYSRFASDWQRKVAFESMEGIDEDLADVIEPQIMTGMDSLSRTGEMQAVRIWLDDLSMLNNIPEDVRPVIKPGPFAQYTATQRGVEHGAFVMSRDEIKAAQEAQAAAAQAQQEQEANLQIQQEAAKTAGQTQ